MFIPPTPHSFENDFFAALMTLGFQLLLCPFCLNSSLFWIFYSPFTCHFLFFFPLSYFFFDISSFYSFNIFSPKWHQLVFLGGGGVLPLYRPLVLPIYRQQQCEESSIPVLIINMTWRPIENRRIGGGGLKVNINIFRLVWSGISINWFINLILTYGTCDTGNDWKCKAKSCASLSVTCKIKWHRYRVP